MKGVIVECRFFMIVENWIGKFYFWYFFEKLGISLYILGLGYLKKLIDNFLINFV